MSGTPISDAGELELLASPMSEQFSHLDGFDE
jgi:hypothetical protein